MESIKNENNTFELPEDMYRRLVQRLQEQLRQLNWEHDNLHIYSIDEYEEKKRDIEDSLEEHYVRFPQLRVVEEIFDKKEASFEELTNARAKIKELDKKFIAIGDSDVINESEQYKLMDDIRSEMNSIFEKYPTLEDEYNNDLIS